jgi:hypothetical protein
MDEKEQEKALITNRVNADICYKNWTQSKPLIEKAISYGADPASIYTYKRELVLCTAIKKDDIPFINFLLEHRALDNHNQKGKLLLLARSQAAYTILKSRGITFDNEADALTALNNNIQSTNNASLIVTAWLLKHGAPTQSVGDQPAPFTILARQAGEMPSDQMLKKALYLTQTGAFFKESAYNRTHKNILAEIKKRRAIIKRLAHVYRNKKKLRNINQSSESQIQRYESGLSELYKLQNFFQKEYAKERNRIIASSIQLPKELLTLIEQYQ